MGCRSSVKGRDLFHKGDDGYNRYIKGERKRGELAAVM